MRIAEKVGGVCEMTPTKLGSAASISAGVGRAVGGRDDLALGVVGVGLDAPAHHELVGLGAVLDDRHGLGRLAERDRQHAGSERIERAGVADLLGVEQALQPRHRLGRGDADRLVEIDPAVDLEARRAAELLRARRGRRRLDFDVLVHRSPSPSSLAVVAQIARDARRLQQRVDRVIGGEGAVEFEAQFGREFEVDAMGDHGAQHLGVGPERGDRRFGVLAAKRHHRDGGVLEVARHAHGGHGDPLAVERRIGDLAALQNVGDGVANRLADALEAVRGAGVFEL